MLMEMDLSFKINKGFKIETKSQNVKNKHNYKFEKCFLTKANKSDYVIIDRISNLDFQKIPEKNRCLKIMTTKNINSIEILDKINSKFKIKSIIISFAVISPDAVEILNKYKINGLIGRQKNEFDFLSNTEIEEIKTDLKKKRISHIKNYIIECENDNFITVITSANPKISSKNEVYIIDNDIEFYKKMIMNFEKI